jgi:hypothetical protein
MPTYTIPFRTFINKQAETLTADYYDVPVEGTGDFRVRLVQIPKSGVITPPSATDAIVVRQVDPITHVHNPILHKVFTIVTTGTPTGSQVLVDSTSWATGALGFVYDTNNGITIEFIYQGLGSIWFASDANELTDGTLLRDGCIQTRHLAIADLALSGDLTVAGALTISGTSVLYLGKRSSDVSAIVANVGCLYYNTTDKQYKGIADDVTPGTAKVVILG